MQELKHSHIYQNITLGSGVAQYCLNRDITLGYGDTDRIGNIIYMKEMELRLVTYPSGTQLAGFARFIMVYDHQPKSPEPALFPDILESAYISVSSYNQETRKRFDILMDKTLPLNPTANGGGSPVNHFKPFIEVNMPCTYKASGTGYTDIETGAIWMFLWASTATRCEFETVLFYEDN